MRTRTLGVVSSLAVVALASVGLAACGDDDGDGKGNGAGNGGTVGVTLQDFKIGLDRTSAPAGKVTFDVENKGPSTHEFVVVKTDLAPASLPTKADGDVDEEGKGIEPVDELEEIAKGATPSLEVELKPGSYVVICNLPAHYRQGMRAAFTAT